MALFLKKLLLSCCILSLLPIFYITLFFFIATPALKTTYVAAIDDKIHRLSTINEPKIILVGNSNTAFGITSSLLEDSTHMPVVNMGLHAGINNEWMEELIQPYIKKGDIVVMIPTIYNDKNNAIDAELTWPMIASNSDARHLLLKNHFFEFISSLPNYMLKATVSLCRNQPFYNDQYARTSFNEYGDITYPRPELLYTFSENDSLSLEISKYTSNRLNEYNKYCTNTGATMVIAAFPIANGQYFNPSDSIVDFQENLQNSLDCTIISDFTDYLIDYEYFYDSNLHLNDRGVSLRTAQLIQDLGKILDLQK